LPHLLVRETGWTLAIGGSLTLAGVLVVLVISRVAHSERELVDLLRQAVRVADAGTSAPHEMGVVAFNLMVWYGLFTAAMAPRFSVIMRHLRVLPIGAARLNALLVGWPTFIWLVAWASGSALHYVVLGHAPTRAHAPSVVAIIGMCALAQAATLRAPILTRLMVFCTAAGSLPLIGLITPRGPVVLGAVGLGCLTAAVALNHVALWRSTTYRQTLPALTPTLGP
jgi:hypothetical protein